MCVFSAKHSAAALVVLGFAVSGLAWALPWALLAAGEALALAGTAAHCCCYGCFPDCRRLLLPLSALCAALACLACAAAEQRGGVLGRAGRTAAVLGALYCSSALLRLGTVITSCAQHRAKKSEQGLLIEPA